MPKVNKKEKDLKVKHKFLSDSPLTAEQEQYVKFGHNEIAEILKDIVLSCPLLFTVGLFGKWGSGKTTILNLLEEKIKVDKTEKVGVVVFDVWKHEKDALRRTFLKESKKQLEEYLPDDFELDDSLETRIVKKVEYKSWKTKVIDRLLQFLILEYPL